MHTLSVKCSAVALALAATVPACASAPADTSAQSSMRAAAGTFSQTAVGSARPSAAAGSGIPVSEDLGSLSKSSGAGAPSAAGNGGFFSGGTAGAAEGCIGLGCTMANDAGVSVVLMTLDEVCAPQESMGTHPAIVTPSDPGCEQAVCGTPCTSCQEDISGCSASDVHVCSSWRRCVPVQQ